MKNTWDACGIVTRAGGAQQVIQASKSDERERQRKMNAVVRTSAQRTTLPLTLSTEMKVQLSQQTRCSFGTSGHAVHDILLEQFEKDILSLNIIAMSVLRSLLLFAFCRSLGCGQGFNDPTEIAHACHPPFSLKKLLDSFQKMDHEQALSFAFRGHSTSWKRPLLPSSTALTRGFTLET